jgi:hypothetical protein
VEADVVVEVEVEVKAEVEPEPLNGLFEIPSTLSLKTAPLIWDTSSDERKLVVELSLLFADEHLELGRDILCGMNDDVRELSLALEIKRAWVYAIKLLFSYEWRDLKTNTFYLHPLKRKNVYCGWATCIMWLGYLHNVSGLPAYCGWATCILWLGYLYNVAGLPV